ncbi:hypothetical protein BX600DRAFT_553774 [Xylariales sp. PMI_506]|nr:hypothetical protein BX600DRAFT_553774 [Xylariales sp. PMI_506]
MSGLQLSDSALALEQSLANYSKTTLMSTSTANTTYQVIGEFEFLAEKSIRSSTIILAAFNTVSAFAAAMGILYDCYKRSQNKLAPGQKVNIFTCVTGAETYPFILSLGITIQGIIFAVSQSQGLEGLFAPGCRLISQFMWPAIFIVPFLQVIFGIEIAARGLRSNPFPPREKWTVSVCLGVFLCLMLIMALVAFFLPSPDICFACLFWFVAKWAEGGFALFTMISVFLIACATIVFRKLGHSTIDPVERVQASRMVYYLAVGVISNLLMVPFFVYLTFNNLGDTTGNTGMTLSMIATVVANLAGLMNGGLHLFFRSNIISTIKPRDKLTEYERQLLKGKIHKPDPNDDYSSSHPLQSISGPKSYPPSESVESLVRYGKGSEPSIRSSPSPNIGGSSPKPPSSGDPFPPISITIPRAPERVQFASAAPAPQIQVRAPSQTYPSYPSENRQNTASITILAPTTYSPIDEKTKPSPFGDFEELQPPPTIGRHKRDSSLVSTATVQIGLRFSNFEDMPPMAGEMVRNAEQVYNLVSPREVKPSPLATSEIPDDRGSTASPLDSTISAWDLMKTLPPVPRAEFAARLKAAETKDAGILTSAVYRPESPTKNKIPSPKGVGFNVPKRSNTSPVQNEVRTPPPSSRSRGNSDAVTRNGDWI